MLLSRSNKAAVVESECDVLAKNLGIFAEGVQCVLSGLLGTGTGTISYNENVGAISITKVIKRSEFKVR